MEASGRGRKQHLEAAGYRNALRKGASDPGRRGKLEAPPKHRQQVDAGWGQRNNSDPKFINKTADFNPSINGSATSRGTPFCIFVGGEEETKREAECWHTPPQGKKIKF